MRGYFYIDFAYWYLLPCIKYISGTPRNFEDSGLHIAFLCFNWSVYIGRQNYSPYE